MIINLIDRMKYSFRKDKTLLSDLHDILGFYPHNLEIYRIALAHKSQAYRSQKGRPLNNERLEFLGDAILEAVVSDIVFHRYERKREGFLTSTRSKIVQRTSLNRLAAEIGLDKLIKTNTQPGSHNNNIGGNAFEALVGAIYLDRGYNYCKWFITKRIVGRLLDLDGVAQKEVNFKSKLLEWTQKNRIQAEFQMNQTAGEEAGEIVFTCAILIEGLKAGEGQGHTKKESQQMAAKVALTKLRREAHFLESIFEAKEKRTAMEAPEVCALPKIEEIEAELADKQATAADKQPATAGKRGKAARTAANRSAKRAPQRPASSPQQDLKKQKPASIPLKAPKINLPDEENTTPMTEKTDAQEKGSNAGKKRQTETENDGQPATRRQTVRGKRVKRTPAPNAVANEQPDGKQETPTARNQTEKPDSEPRATTDEKKEATKSSPSPRRRRSGRENEASESDLRAERERREDIVRQAEEAAYGE